jgi:hypothetical protein
MQGWLLVLIVAGAFAVGCLGMVLWWLEAHAKGQRARTDGDYSPARNIDRKGGGRQDARTRGRHAPAINERGK